MQRQWIPISNFEWSQTHGNAQQATVSCRACVAREKSHHFWLHSKQQKGSRNDNEYIKNLIQKNHITKKTFTKLKKKEKPIVLSHTLFIRMKQAKLISCTKLNSNSNNNRNKPKQKKRKPKRRTKRSNQRERERDFLFLLKYEFNAFYIIHGQLHLIQMEHVEWFVK